MVDLRQWLTVGLGALFGLLLLVAPRTALRLSVVSRPGRRRRRGEYGGEDAIPDTWVWATRAAGIACLAAAASIAL